MRNTIKITTPDGEVFVIEYDQKSSPVPKELFEEMIERSIYKMFFKRTNLIKEVLCLREARFYLQKALFFIINQNISDRYDRIGNYDFNKLGIPYIEKFIIK